MSTPMFVKYKVSIVDITFPFHKSGIYQTWLNHLKRVYNGQGCKPALYPLIAEISSENIDNLRVPGKDNFLHSVECLNGFHRIETAKQVLEGEIYWIVQVYNKLDPEVEQDIINGDFASGVYTNGTILLNYFSGHTTWQTALLERMAKTLKTVNYHYGDEFRRLAQFDGLWYKINDFGSMAQRPAMFKDAWKLYLNNVYEFWSQFPPGSADPVTVRTFHLLCSCVARDKRAIHKNKWQLFKRLANWERITAFKTLQSTLYTIVPTLRSFFDKIR